MLAGSEEAGIDARLVSVARPLEYATTGGKTAHALFYAPHNPDHTAPDGERPPLLVRVHGGPTAHVTSRLDREIQFFTSRGFAVVDVNYGGSTGYGREYRERLHGQWGIVDVDDAVNAALALAEAGEVDRARLAITGGSAGGWTVLCAAAFHPDVFAAGADYFGVSDLMGFVDDTHKFESRYNDWLVGPWPEAEELWRERSPVNFADRIRAPIIILQGLEDAIVPPSQSEIVVEGARARTASRSPTSPSRASSTASARPTTLKRAVEAELSFYAQVFGFEPPATSNPCRSSGRDSPRGGRVVLQEHAVEVLARLAADDRVIDPRRAVDEVQRRVEALFGEPHLGRVRPLVGDPAGVDRGHQDAVGRQQLLRAGAVSMFSAALAMFVCGWPGPL